MTYSATYLIMVCNVNHHTIYLSPSSAISNGTHGANIIPCVWIPRNCVILRVIY